MDGWSCQLVKMIAPPIHSLPTGDAVSAQAPKPTVMNRYRNKREEFAKIYGRSLL